jgi:hypothetical protein
MNGMKKNQLISVVALSCVLMVGASTAFAQSNAVLGVKYQTNNQGQRVNVAGGIQGSKEQVNNLGDKVNTAGSIQGSKDQVNSLGDHVNTAGGVSHLTVGDKAINGQVYNDRKVTLVPLRVIFETLGYTVTWKQVAKEIILSNDKNDVVKIKAGKDAHIKNGKAYVSTDFLVKGMKLTVTNEAGHVSIKETP